MALAVFFGLFFFCLDKFQKTLVKVLRQQIRQLVRWCGLDIVQHIRQPLLRIQVIHRTRLKETVHHRRAPCAHEILKEQGCLPAPLPTT